MKSDVVRLDKHCRICGSDAISSVFKLQDTPLEDQFVSEQHKDTFQPVFPLELALCAKCGYVFLPHIVSPEASYSDYIYVSSVTTGLRNHYDQYAEEIVSRFDISRGALAVDLGSNDGSMLASFKRLGMHAVGVEPAEGIAAQANASGYTTINSFFSGDVAQDIVHKYGNARIVTANYMYANIDSLTDFTNAVAKLLAPDGIFVVQTGYHPEQMKINMFDYIYHEHFSYFTVAVLQYLCGLCGLEIVHAEKTTPKGGSVRVVAQLVGGPLRVDASVQQLIDEEHIQGMRDPMTYKAFAQNIENLRGELLGLLDTLKAAGKSIVGFGASHSTTTLIYHYGLAKYLDYLVDDNTLKHGRYSPGHHLPVFPTDRLVTDHPNFAVVLGWQHQDSIMSRHADYLASGGSWIVPLPSVRVVGSSKQA